MKRKGLRKILVFLVMAFMLIGLMPTAAMAGTADSAKQQVHVIIENTTFNKASSDSGNADPAWSGTLLDEWVDIDSSSTMMSCIKDAIELKDYTQTGADSGYISEINGLKAFDCGSDSGWMGTLNDWFTSEAFTAYTVANGKLEAGDEIRMMYTVKNMGEDLGGGYGVNDKTVKAVSFSAGKLDKTFDKDTHEYTLKLPTDTESVKVTPTATAKNYMVKTYLGTQEKGTEYKRTSEIPVKEGDVITVVCGDKSWPTMNDNTIDAQTYSFTVAFEGEKDIASGTDGNINWVIKYDGTMVISAVDGTDGKMNNYASDAKQPWASYRTEIKKLVVEDGVTQIGNYAFSGFSKMEDVDIADSVKSIGHQVFKTCSNLTEVTIPCNVGKMAFNSCKKLRTVTFLDGFEEAGAMAFISCTNLETINFPKTLKKFDSKWFTNAKNIKSITVAPGGEFSMQNDLLCQGTKVVYVPAYVSGSVAIPEGITEIGEKAFYQKTDITSVTFPETLKTIGAYAFNGSGLEGRLTLPKNITTYGKCAFGNCKGITEVKFETNNDEKLMLGSSLFSCCSKLKSIEIPENITQLDKMVWSCSDLAYIDLKNVTEITEEDLSYCLSSLNGIYIHKCLTVFNESFRDTHPKVIYYEGSEEDWDKITFNENTKANIEKYGIKIVYNYKGTPNGEAPVIKNTLKDMSVSQYLRCDALTVELEEDKDADVFYSWYVNDTLTSDGEKYNPSTAELGTFKIYAKVTSVKDGKVGVAYTNTATVTVTELKSSNLLKGSGTETDPYLIRNAEDLNNLSSLVQYFDSFEGKYFKMTADITLPDGWTPIGCTKDGITDIQRGANLMPFSGIFDGGNHTLTVPKGGLPLLGYIKGAEVKNLNIYGEEIAGYGLVNNFEGVGLSGSAIVIDNVTLKSGTKTLKSGLLGGNITTNGYAGNSAGFVATVKNCTIEEGVVIGYDGEQSLIGGFAGRMQGTIENCVNYGTVKGKNYVGGIIGTRDNAMGSCAVTNCKFYGTVEASGSNAGGIAGGGYSNGTAPNGVKITVKNCDVNAVIKGKNNVGGIIGSDLYVAQAWNGYELKDNSFAGTVSGESNVGGIIGFYDSLNRLDDISGNTYTLDCGADSWVGSVKYVDTNCENPTAKDGTTYFSTENDTSACPEVTGCGWKTAHNRTDDPLGADAEKLAKGVESDKMIAAKVDDMIEAIDMTASDKADQVTKARAAYEALTETQQKLVSKISKLEAYEKQLTNEEKAAAVDKLIDKIGDVSIKSGSAIETAENAYSALTDEQKALVKNYDALTKARSAYDALKAEQAEKLIEALPDADKITLNDKDAVNAAKAAYDALTDNQKKLISEENVSKLEAVEAAYADAVKESAKDTAGDKTMQDSGKNTEESTSKTGDDSDAALWIALMLLAGSTAAGTAAVARKRKSYR